MSQQPFWQGQPWNYQQQEESEYVDYDGSNQYLLLQAGQIPQRYLPQLPTDVLTFGGLPTQLIGEPLLYIDNSNLTMYEQLGTGSIQQEYDALSTPQNSLTHRQQRQQQWLSQYPYSRQREAQTPHELFTPTMQFEHQFDRQNSVQDMLGVVPIERSDYDQLQVYPGTSSPSISRSQGNQVPELQTDFNQLGNGFPDQPPQTETDELERSSQSQATSHQQRGESNSSSSNILIKSGIAKITDFGLSGQMMSSSLGEGTAAYRDPLSFRNEPYKRGKKSDVFSLGVLFWEISSGQIPCKKWTNMTKCREEGY
ncbi:1072_t:CDS:2 [Paraglomus occultum]|uniref:1072_t:CDS:1 n=1 Tax=Paraglomus occultum TaxID=144539 RepID=A0A9N9C913_9GLOM|nr:1072_t:CDS:2 [Paraglomus occultum]